jgi:endonuclease I/V8-like Glu-specific endopeptidase
MPDKGPNASDVPFDASLLKDAERRYKSLAGANTGVGALHETLSYGLDSEKAPSRGRAARELLRSNPQDAIARRLERIGVKRRTAEQAAEAVKSDPSPPAYEMIGEEPGAGTEEPLGLERIINRSELLGVQYLDGGLAASGTVARVVVRNAQGQTLGHGTGSMISPRLLLTNHHVLKDAAVAGRSIVEFNYQDDLRGELLPAVRFRLQPNTFFETSPLNLLDFTVVAVAEVAEDGTALSSFGFNPLGALEGEILAGESVTIIQHPNGEPKQIALRENLVLKFPKERDDFLHYQTDTTPGSSGSPVYNDQWELIALHHAGFPRKDAAGNILAIDGQIWKKWMGEHKIDWIANEGVRTRAIVKHLRGLTHLDAGRKTLIDAVLEATGGESLSRSVLGSTSAGSGVRASRASADAPGVQSGEREGGGPTLAGGQAQWIIPLHVSVSLGMPTMQGGGTTGVGMAVASNPPTATADSGVTNEPRRGSQDDLEDKALREAKEELRRSATRVYLDKDAESRDKAAYYRVISLGSSSRELFSILSRLLEQTHENRPSYAPSRMLYPWVDLQRDLRIQSIYSGEGFDPLELIRQDLEVDRARAEQLELFRRTEAASDPVALEMEEAQIEASLPYNCEHVVPQSWFKKREPMRGDLHHLFACESGCNSFRGNIPYFDFRTEEEVVRAGCGRREADRFQPTSGLGAVARATLYFLLRYPGSIRSGRSTYTDDRLEMLESWHKEFEVSEYERHRNQAIFEIQGNRNPLIDHPDWVDKIDFSVGLG